MSRDVRGYGAAYKLSTEGPSDEVLLASANFIGGKADEPKEKLTVGEKVMNHNETRYGIVKASEGSRIRVQFGYMENEQWWPTKTETLLASHVKKVEKFPDDKKTTASNWLGSFLNFEERGSANG
jgi:hypothetical protein